MRPEVIVSLLHGGGKGNKSFALQKLISYDAVNRPGLPASSYSTAILRQRSDVFYPIRSQEFLGAKAAGLFASAIDTMKKYQYVALFGCPEHLVVGGDTLFRDWTKVSEGNYFVLYRNDPLISGGEN